MNKSQWYSIGTFLFLVGVVMSMGSNIGLGELPRSEFGVVLLELIVYKLIGTVCVIASFVCGFCGLLE